MSARPNINILDDDIKNASGDTVTAGVSRQLRQNLALHVDGVYTNLRDFARTQNINQAVPAFDFKTLTAAQAATITAFTTAQINARRPLANWGNVTELASNGWSDYRALYVRLDKRFANRYQYLLSYTRDWTTNNVNNITDFYNPDLETGPSGRKHTLVASGYARLPFELTLGSGLDDPVGAAVRRSQRRRSDGRRHGRSRAGRHAEHGGQGQRGDRAAPRARQRLAGGARTGADSRGPDREQRLQPGRPACQPDVRAAVGHQRRSAGAGVQSVRPRQPDWRNRRGVRQQRAVQLVRAVHGGRARGRKWSWAFGSGSDQTESPRPS